MRFALVVSCAAACESPPPTCAHAVAHAVNYVELTTWVDRADLPAMEELVPLDHAYTGSDVAYLVDSCAQWPVSYRRCIGSISSDNDFVTCNQHDETKTAWMAWSSLPHVSAWLHALSDLAGDAAWAAIAAKTDATQAVDALEAAGSAGSAELAAAKAKASAAAALEAECEARPLEKPACLALITNRKR
ncbi:MAG TPA: hypothetical protein VGG28_26925 [Kofleriaceae bacterium]